MTIDSEIVWQLCISAVTLLGIWLQGNKDPRGWSCALINQVMWAAWIVIYARWGFAPLTFALTLLYARNWWKWRKECAPVTTVFGKRTSCRTCETQRVCAQHGCFRDD